MIQKAKITRDGAKIEVTNIGCMNSINVGGNGKDL